MAWALICATPTNCSGSSSACTAPRTTKAPAWGWPPCSASSTVMAAAFGPKRKWIRERPSALLSDKVSLMSENMIEILLVEDNPNDVELTLHAFRKNNPTNRIHVVRDGAEALDFIFCTGAYADRNIQNSPKVVLLDLKLPKVDGLEVLRS